MVPRRSRANHEQFVRRIRHRISPSSYPFRPSAVTCSPKVVADFRPALLREDCGTIITVGSCAAVRRSRYGAAGASRLGAETHRPGRRLRWHKAESDRLGAKRMTALLEAFIEAIYRSTVRSVAPVELSTTEHFGTKKSNCATEVGLRGRDNFSRCPYLPRQRKRISPQALHPIKHAPQCAQGRIGAIQRGMRLFGRFGMMLQQTCGGLRRDRRRPVHVR